MKKWIISGCIACSLLSFEARAFDLCNWLLSLHERIQTHPIPFFNLPIKGVPNSKRPLDPRLAESVAHAFDAGPFRWIKTRNVHDGRILFQRGIGGGRGSNGDGAKAALGFLTGTSTYGQVIARDGVDAARRIEDDLFWNALFASPLLVRGRSDTLRMMSNDIGQLPIDDPISLITEIGFFPSRRNAPRWAQNFLQLRAAIVEKGIFLDSSSRGAQFAKDLQRALGRNLNRDFSTTDHSRDIADKVSAVFRKYNDIQYPPGLPQYFETRNI